VSTAVAASQRYIRDRRCPICGGAEADPRGQAKRCNGYLSPDGEYARCSRDEHAGALAIEAATETYVHRLTGDCRCGQHHGADATRSKQREEILAVYRYLDEKGAHLYDVLRIAPKTFRPRRPDGKRTLDGVRRVLYRLPELLAADPGETVFVVEGEKDVDNMRRLGLVATTNAGGAGKWRPEYNDALRGRRVVVIQDCDDESARFAGQRHAEQVAKALADIAASVKVLALPGPGKDASDWIAAGGTAEKLRELAVAEPPSPSVALANRIRSLKPIPRLLTQFATLNSATRGGLPLRCPLFIGGAPEAGKTTMAVGLGLYQAARGAHVTILAVDEDFEDVSIRIGQAEGFSRDEIEKAEPGTLGALADRVEESYPNLEVLDGDEVLLEEAAEALQLRAKGEPAILVIDSLQTVRARGAEGLETRPRIEAVVRVVKRIARMGITSIATSEVGRGLYRSKNPAERTEGLASFKETGAIEYGAKLALVMRSVVDEVGLVDVEIVKNRFGKKPPFRLRLDFARAVFEEVSGGVAPGDVANPGASNLVGDLLRARTALAENPGITGKFALASKLTGIGRTRAWEAVRALDQNGEIDNRGTKSRPRLYLRDASYPELSLLSGIGGRATGSDELSRYPHPFRGDSDGDSSAPGLGDADKDMGSIPEDRL
jgi:KaiC/GvpD/RAD55 family RecA-like ATPase